MITFIHLKVEQCPTCGCATIVRESIETDAHYITHREPQIRVHCNGQRWESRQFLCGCVVNWVPNFGQPEVGTVCPKHPDIVKYYEDQKRLAVKEREIQELRSGLSSVDGAVRRKVNQQLRKPCSA